MSKTRDTGFLANVIQVHDTGVRIMSGSEMLMAISSSGQVTITGELSGSDAANSLLLDGTGSLAFTTTASFLVVSASQQQISSSLLQVSASYISLSASYTTFSGSASTRISNNETSSNSLTNASASFSTRTTQVEKTYATTGSNTYTGTQNFSSTCTPNGFNSGASIYTAGGLQVTNDAYFSSSVFIKGNVTVYGTQSVAYISSSQLNIGTNTITVNTFTPSVRFGGLSVFDSGSTGLTGSIFWDSELNRWIYVNASGSGGGATYGGGMFISGPRNTQGMGCEQGTTACMLLVGQGGDHMTSSMIYHDSAVTCIPNTLIGGVGCFSGQICAPTVVASTCLAVRAGSATLVANNIAGAASNNHFAMQRNDAQYASIGLNGSDNFTVFGTSTSCPRLIIDGSGIASFANNVCSPNFIASSTCSTAGLRVYGASGTHQWDMYLNGANLRFSDNTTGGCLVVDTAASFSSTVTTAGQIIANAINGAISVSGTGYTSQPTNMVIGRYTSTIGYIQVPTNGNFEIWDGGTSAIAIFNATGKTTTLYGALTGTSAAFSSTITGTTIYGSTMVCAASLKAQSGFADLVLCGSNTTSPHIGGTFTITTNQDGNGRTIIGNAAVGRAMYLEANGNVTFNCVVSAPAANISTSTICTIASTTLGSSRGIVIDANTTTNNSFVPIGFSWASSVSSYNPTWGMALKTISYNAGTADLVFYTGNNVRLTIGNGGGATFSGGVTAGSFSTSTCTFAATSAGTNYDITGPGSGRWLASVGTNAVYHWNGVLALTFFDSADFGVNILTCGSYNTAASVSIVNSGSSLRFCFSQNVGTVTVNYLNL